MDNLAYLAAVVNEEPGLSGWINVYNPACKRRGKTGRSNHIERQDPPRSWLPNPKGFSFYPSDS